MEQNAARFANRDLPLQEKERNSARFSVSPVANVSSDGTVQLPSVGTPLSSVLPSPAWSGKSRRRRAASFMTIPPHCESTVSLGHVIKKSTATTIAFAKDHSLSDEILLSRDEVSPGLCTGSDSMVSLDQITKTSTMPRSQFARGHSPSDDSELACDEVPLDLCSARSVITATLGHCSIKKSSSDESPVIDSLADAVTFDPDKKLPMSDDS